MFEGLRTVVYHVADLEAAKGWWSGLLNVEPYFDEPFYVGFNVGGYELGLHPAEWGAATGAVTYWGVKNVEEAFERLLAQGGVTVQEFVHDVGGGIRLGAVRDGSGNVIGVIENPHFSLPAAG